MPTSTITPRHSLRLLTMLLAGATAQPAMASPTVTNLGSGASSFYTDGNSIRYVTTTDNQWAYPFLQTTGQLLSPKDLIDLPLITPAPTGTNGYNVVQQAMQGSNGLVAGIEVRGVLGQWYQGTIFTTTRNADGTWTAPVQVAQTPIQAGNYGWNTGMSIDGINALNQALVGTGGGSPPGALGPKALVYDGGTNTTTDLSALLGNNWLAFRPIALDNLGRVLVQGDKSGGGFDSVLITPQGVPATPIRIPEPGTLVILACLFAPAAVRSWRGRRRALGGL